MLHFVVSLLAVSFAFACEDSGTKYAEGDRWLRNGNFLVECRENKIEVVKCITDQGTVLDIGTEKFHENGQEFSCLSDEIEEGSGEADTSSINVSKCDELQDGEDLIVENLIVCCISKRFKGCLDVAGRPFRSGLHFTLGHGLLKFCNIQQNGYKARIEPKGCFNGTVSDNAENTQLHIKKYAVWREGDKEMRCGDHGIHLYRCFVDGKGIYTGTATIAKDGSVFICQ